MVRSGDSYGGATNGASRPTSGGGDWALFDAAGTMALDARLTLRADDGALLLRYGGRLVTPPNLRAAMAERDSRHSTDPARYYFRTSAALETGDLRYAWLNDTVLLGSGYLAEGAVAYRVFEVR